VVFFGGAAGFTLLDFKVVALSLMPEVIVLVWGGLPKVLFDPELYLFLSIFLLDLLELLGGILSISYSDSPSMATLPSSMILFGGGLWSGGI
jgi:hypothetical protein